MRRPFIWILAPLLLLLAGCGTGQFEAHGWSGLTLEEDLLYVGMGDGRVLVLNTEYGELVWPFPSKEEDPLGAVYAAPTVVRDTVYLATADTRSTGRLYAIENDGASPSQKWFFPPVGFPHAVGNLVARPAVTDEMVLVGSSDGTVYALDEADGNVLWEYSTGGRVWSSPVVDGDTVYFGSLDHNLYAVSLKNGEERWRLETEGAITGTPLVANGLVYIGSFDRNLYATDSRSGREVWRHEMDGWVWASPITDGRTLYVGTLAGSLFALDLASGRELWSVPLEGSILVPPVFVGDDLAVVTDEKTLHVLDPRRGQQRRPCFLDESVRTPLATKGERVYVVDTRANVLEINTRSCSVRWLVRDGDE